MIAARYIKIDLTQMKSQPYPIPAEDQRKFVGGKALAARIIYRETPAGVDPLGPQSMMIINTGPLCGTGAPSSSRYNITARSVMTGGINTSNCGGNFGAKLRQAGFDGILLTGKAEKPVYIEILDGEVLIKDAQELWGKDTEQTQKAFPDYYGKLVIGPAGENGVSYASLISDERVNGRGGVGAIFGAKNLKAVVAYGTQPIPLAQPEKFKRHCEKWIRTLQNHPATGMSMPRYGTPGMVSTANVTRILPRANFTDGGFAGADKISGETLTEEYLTRNYGCLSCVIRCERRVKVNEREVKGPEYETLGLLGSNLVNSDMQQIIDVNYQADLLGLDTISLGGTLAAAMELQQRGVVDLGVHFGDVSNLNQVIEDVAYRRNHGAELARGSRYLAEKYGVPECSQNVKGLEIASYDPRKAVGMGLGYATSNRGGCHLNGGYLVFMEGIGPVHMDPHETRSKAEWTIFMQNLIDAVSSVGSCLFTTYAVFPSILYTSNPRGWLMRTVNKLAVNAGGALALMMKYSHLLSIQLSLIPYSAAVQYATGERMTLGDFMQFGERCYNMERLYNTREGLSRKDDRLPIRMSTPQLTDGRRDTASLDQMLERYYQVRGWDAQGIPTPEKVSALGI